MFLPSFFLHTKKYVLAFFMRFVNLLYVLIYLLLYLVIPKLSYFVINIIIIINSVNFV